MPRTPFLVPLLLLCACGLPGLLGAADQRGRLPLQADEQRGRWQQLMAQARSALAQGDLARAEQTVRAALTAAVPTPDGDVEAAGSHALLAEVLTAAGQPAAAEASYRAALAASTGATRAAGALSAICGQGLARLLVSSGRLADAQAQLRSTLARCAVRGGADAGAGTGEADCALTAAMLADLEAAAGHAREAGQLYQRALAAWSTPGSDPEGKAATAHLGLAQLALAQDDDTLARTHLERARGIIEAAQGDGAPALILVFGGIAAIQLRSGEVASAEALLARTLILCETHGLGKAACTAEVLEPLAGIHASTHALPAARSELERAIAIRSALPGGDVLRLGSALVQYAEVLRAAGSMAEAVAAYRTALTQWQGIAGVDQADLATVHNGLASALALADQPEEAQAHFATALALLEQRFGVDASELVPLLANQEQLFATRAHYPQAIAVGERALTILEHHGGTDRREYVVALNQLIGAVAQSQDYVQAIALNRRASAIVERSLGSDDPNLATTLQNGAALLRATGQADEAARLEARATAILAKNREPQPLAAAPRSGE